MGNIITGFNWYHKSDCVDLYQLIIVKLQQNMESLLKIQKLDNRIGISRGVMPCYIACGTEKRINMQLSGMECAKLNNICDFCQDKCKKEHDVDDGIGTLTYSTSGLSIVKVTYHCEPYFSLACMLSPYYHIYPTFICGVTDNKSILYNFPYDIRKYIIKILISKLSSLNRFKILKL